MIEKYKWTDELEPFCISIAFGAKREAVETAFRIVPDSRKLTKVAELWDFAGPESQGNDVVQIDALANGIIAFENNGWTGEDNDGIVIKAIGCPAFVSIFRNVNAVMSFVYAKDGIVVRRFDPLLYEAEGALPEEKLYAWNLEHPTVSAFALAETLTGIEITQAWMLDQPHPTYRTLFGNK